MKPAQDHFTKGLKYGLDDSYNEAINELETAIEMGLLKEDEMYARLFLGDSYSHLINKDLDIEEMILTQEFSETINQMGKAVLMDFEGGYKFFEEPEHRALLQTLDIAYSLQARTIQKKHGIDSAIVFYKDKLKLFDYLSSTPMLTLLTNLGVLYNEKEEKNSAYECFKKILDADVVNPDDEMGYEAETRQKAENNLQALENKDKKCFIATAVYGDSNAYQVLILKRYRDEVLLLYPIGRRLVFLYYLYCLSPLCKWCISLKRYKC
jgi:hypothetical protein